MNSQLSFTAKTQTNKIRFCLTGKSIKVDRAGNYAPELKAQLIGYKVAEVKAVREACNITSAYTPDSALEVAEALKDAGFTVVIAKEAMEHPAVNKTFSAPKPGAEIGTIVRRTSNSTTYFITCATLVECMAAFTEIADSYHPCGYGTSVQSTKTLANGTFMIKVSRSNSCD